MIIGSHVGCSGKKMLLGSVEEAISYGSNTFMFYTGAPQNTRRKPIEEFNLEQAKALMAKANIDYNNVIVHAPYIINLANTTKPETFEIAVEFLQSEIKRCDELGIKHLVLHPGAHVGAGVEVGLEQIVEGLNMVLNPKQTVKVAIETMSGKGSECGSKFEELKYIIDHVKHPELITVCIDTCHLNDAGYDVSNFDQVLDEFDRVIGLERLAVIHLNDSKNELGAKKDRHENIGFGYLGFDTIINVVYNKRIASVPIILETPYIDNLKTKKREYPPYKYEIEMIRNKCFDKNLKDNIRSNHVSNI